VGEVQRVRGPDFFGGSMLFCECEQRLIRLPFLGKGERQGFLLGPGVCVCVCVCVCVKGTLGDFIIYLSTLRGGSPLRRLQKILIQE
jgi:hypothetical protein